MSDVVEAFARLFDGRANGYGGNEGQCVKEPLTLDRIRQHLDGTAEPIGIYPAVPRNGPDDVWVKWGCSDIDYVGDDQTLPRNLQAVLAALGITSWVERSRSKGFHVWVFAEEWVPAATMRRALLAAHQIADVAATEVNPKQESLAHLKGGWGNYVRLCYPGGLASTPTRQVVLADDVHRLCLPLSIFVEQATAERTPTAALEGAVALWIPPPPRKHVELGEHSESELEEALVSRMGGLAWTIWKDGPLPRPDGGPGDRSNALLKLAHRLAEQTPPHEITPAEAYRILLDADERWGKFSERGDAEEQLGRMVERAFG